MDKMDKLLYEHIGRAGELWLESEELPDNVPEHHFSPEFEAKMDALIRDYKPARKKRPLPSFAMRVAAAVLVFVCVGTVFSAPASAAWRQVVDTAVRAFHELTEYRFTSGEDATPLPRVSFSYVPVGMYETACDLYDGTHSRIVYEADNGLFFELQQQLIKHDELNDMIADTEDVPVDTFPLRDTQARSITKNGRTTIFWTEENALYVLLGSLPADEMRAVALGLEPDKIF